MRWALVWMFVAGGAATAAVREARTPAPQVASAEAAAEPDPVPVPLPAPPRGGFGGVPSMDPAGKVPSPPTVTIAPTEIDILEPEEVDNDHGCVLDEIDRCPDLPEGYDGPIDLDGCPEPDYPRTELRDGIEVKIDRHVIDGRDIITESSIIIY